MDRGRAILELREAVSSYQSYCYFVGRGEMLVNARDDPADIIEAARMSVGNAIRVCQSLGLTDDEIAPIVAEEYGRWAAD